MVIGQVAPAKKKKRRLNPVALMIVGGILVAIVLIAVIGSWLFLNPKTGGTPEAACFLLIDRSGSVSQSVESLEDYQEMANAAVDGCAGDSAVLLIAAFGQNGSSIDYAERAEAASETDSKFFRLYRAEARTSQKGEQQRRDHIAAAHTAAAEILSSPGSEFPTSDILSAVDQASTDLRGVADDFGLQQVFLVVISDGIHISDTYSFESFSEAGSAEDYVGGAIAEGYTADLSGIMVDFAGVKTGLKSDGSEQEEWFENETEEFWSLYVPKSGGSLCYYEASPLRLPVDC